MFRVRFNTQPPHHNCANIAKHETNQLIDIGAVDLDIYGAFQFCAIGILAAPVTVRLSKTYFYDPGRNTIFLWAALILAGKWICSSQKRCFFIGFKAYL